MYATRPSRMMRRLREGKMVLESYAQIADPAQVEIVGLGGFDALSLHWEYTSVDFQLLEDLCRAAAAVDVDLIVRVPELNHQLIKRVLDTGANGIWLPHDGSGLEGAKRALDAMRYPPKGLRTPALRTRFTGHSALTFEEAQRRSEEEIILVVCPEDAKSLEQLEEIASLDGVTFIHIGPIDCAQILGVEWDDPRVAAKLREIFLRVKAIGKAKMLVSFEHTHLKWNAKDLKDLGVGCLHVVPPATTVLLRYWQAKAKEIRDGLSNGRTY